MAIDETTKFLDITMECIVNDGGYIEFKETLESALNRVAKTFGFNYKSMHVLCDNFNYDSNEDDKYIWYAVEGIWSEGYFRINGIIYHFRYDRWDCFKPSLWTEA